MQFFLSLDHHLETLLAGIDWDDLLPEELKSVYQEFRRTLPSLENLTIPRWTKVTKGSQLELHGFCDASQKAYAAVVYLRVKDNDEFYCNILAAKTKVAPTKPVTLPRLELMGAVYLSKLITKVKTALKMPTIPIYCWRDSTITLAWIHSDPAERKPFVANRIAKIQESVAREHWRHVRSKDDAADVASRGIMPNDLHGLNLWFHGPAWLQQEFTPESVLLEETTKELRKAEVHHARRDKDFIQNFSSYHRLIRCVAFIRRYVTNF